MKSADKRNKEHHLTHSGNRLPSNSDQPDFPYIIRIEGLSADGRPFSRNCLVEP